jgi:hypothetical protein
MWTVVQGNRKRQVRNIPTCIVVGRSSRSLQPCANQVLPLQFSGLLYKNLTLFSRPECPAINACDQFHNDTSINRNTSNGETTVAN